MDIYLTGGSRSAVTKKVGGELGSGTKIKIFCYKCLPKEIYMKKDPLKDGYVCSAGHFLSSKELMEFQDETNPHS